MPSLTQPSSRSSMIGKSKRPHREIRFGSYVLGSTLGEGEFGKVKLGWRKDGKTPGQAAIKLIRRDSIPRGSDRESKVHREINSLKKLAHPNIVRLEEVLQNDKYIGIVLEYASGGELFDYILEHRYLKDSMACKLFAQLVSGVDYMHSKGIVHRDLKLENLLLDKHKNIIISDFGFVNSFRDGNELMKTSCGSPCYAAPELVVSNEPYELRKVDVWSCGVILYAMLAGYLPFDDDPQNPEGDNIARLYHYITHTPLTFPEYVQPISRDLLRKLVVSNPKKRITLKEVRSHQWLSPHAPFLSVTPQEWDRNYRSTRSRLHSNVEITNRRHSLMESKLNNNSSFLISPQTSSLGKKFYSNILAPQTSSSHAIATLPSTPNLDSPELKPSILENQNKTSIASIALQAVVNADDSKHLSDTKMLPPQLPNSSGSSSTNNSSRLPMPHIKPRPTSYHPGSMQNSADFYSLLPFTLNSNISTSPKTPQEKRNSWSKISEPQLDMSIVNGMLTNNNFDNFEKRKSILLDSLSIAMESLNSKDDDKSLVDTESPITEITEAETSTLKLVQDIETLVPLTSESNTQSIPTESLILLTSESNTQSLIHSESLVPESNIPSLIPTESLTLLTLLISESNIQSLTPITSESLIPNESLIPPILDVSKTESLINSSLINSLNESSPIDDSNKLSDPIRHRRSRIENKENKTIDKTKRFSFFYPIQESEKKPIKPINRKVLEPNNDLNIKIKSIDDKKRQINNKNKESSAAKKVVDFFKRRSMRV